MLTWLSRRWLPYVVGAVLLVVTALLALAGFADDRRVEARNQRTAATQAVNATTTLVSALENRVTSLRSLFRASESVTPEEFAIFTEPLLAGQRTAGLGWVDIVPGDDRRSFERWLGRPIRWYDGGLPELAPRRARYLPLTYMEPKPAQLALGYDVLGFPGQRDVVERAAETGRTQLSEPVKLPGSAGLSLVLYAPAYAPDAPTDTPAQRVRALTGYGVGVFRFSDLHASLMRTVPAGTQLTISAGGQKVVEIGKPGDDADVQGLDVGGQRWTFLVEAGSGRHGFGLGWMAVIVGSVVTVLVTLLTRQVVRATAAVRELADVRERERHAIASSTEALLHHLDELYVISHDRADLRVVEASGGLLRAMGLKADAIVGLTSFDIAEAEPSTAPILDALIAARDGRHVSFDHRDQRTGRTLWLRAVPVPDIDRVLLVGLDVSPRVEAERARTSAEERFRRAFEDAPVGMALMDAAGHLIEVNDELCRILGSPARDLIGRELPDRAHPEDADAQREHLADLLAGRTMRCSYESRALRADGREVWIAVHATALGSGAGGRRLLLAQILDITDQRRFEQQLRHLADHDPLTGLGNRRTFERAVDAHLAHVKRYGDEGALLMLDLDHFKAVNDTLGHHAGDALILAIADILRETVRETDRVARLGGDEFAILLPRADREQAEIVADKLVRTIRDRRQSLGGSGWAATVSIGVALFSADTERGEQLLANADLAMYDAKEAGRDRYAVHANGDRAASQTRARLAWMDRIRHALDEDRFTLLAQPILDMRSGEVVHHELLLRMIGPEGQLVGPRSFLPTAERYGLVAEIDAWVVQRAIRTLAEHGDAGLVLEVNLSGSSIGSDSLLEMIERQLRDADVDPRALIFEVTETAAVSNIAQARVFAERLAALGCRFALDDFGAGFGSFLYLKHLPFDFLKIDGEFVRHLVASQDDRVIVSSLVQVAGGLGKRTIAEYVDAPATLDVLRDLGVDLAQGYAIGRPAPLHAWLTGSDRAAGAAHM